MTNNKKQAIEKITEFLKSDEKIMLLKGTHQYNKHKLIMALLDKNYKNAKILFRINGMSNLTGENFVGFAGITKVPKIGDNIKIYNNYYEFDTINKSSWSKSSSSYNFAIIYPLDAYIRNNDIATLVEDLTISKKIDKIFLVTWTDRKDYDYSKFSKHFDREVIYDAEEEDLEYHKRMLED
ncbi:MAG TPA: hypothetical protein DEP72_03715 [Clostridiales bacterium]|nr:MAG: hypothetical protein A2Y18_05355 [Clostridiales bacterium GWD2_32_19]HCC07261.1 hypothetical protein [Clostridiales bacterium]